MWGKEWEKAGSGLSQAGADVPGRNAASPFQCSDLAVRKVQPLLSSKSHWAWSAGGAEAPAVRLFHLELHVAQTPIGFLARGSQVERTIKSRRRGAGRDGPERMQRMELISCPGGILELFGLSSTPSPPSQRQTQ